jgi:hypothetical protein
MCIKGANASGSLKNFSVIAKMKIIIGKTYAATERAMRFSLQYS